MTINYLFAGLVVTLLCAFTAVSADASESLSLSQAVDMAVRANPTIAAGQLSANAAKQAARGARALTNPEIIVAPSIVGDAGSDSAVLVSQPLELNGSRRVRSEIASNQANAAGYDAVTTRRGIVLRVSQSYWDSARAQELVKLNQENIAYLEWLSAVKTATKPQDMPRTNPPKLSLALTDALGEIRMVEAGYSNSIPVDKMSYFSAGIRMIAMSIYDAQKSVTMPSPHSN